jgi:hypothetical protein
MDGGGWTGADDVDASARFAPNMKAPDFLVLSQLAAIDYEPTAATEVCISITNPGGSSRSTPPRCTSY